MPEAMLFAKLTLCSHGNGSCWSRVKTKTKQKNEGEMKRRSFIGHNAYKRPKEVHTAKTVFNRDSEQH